ncbi:MAG: phosphoribosylanthranilate isomerase [Desulfobacterales bacterium]|mgnify:CR=1 FL=1|jgi:phosphoribosylanthranilate isomerase|nr:phosphoribosylanthranilate isomerase [Desulfobacteraceae bacterium]MBT7086514.1 phosphoribosylanthranilate isomerase [Desulfobacterales bacterium]
MKKKQETPQIKICGLTRVDQALKCVELGADAIGLVFYPKSPRNITDMKAKEICIELPSKVSSVGVFVNESFEFIMDKVNRCHLKTVQLHGNESPALVRRLQNEDVKVIKLLYTENEPSTINAKDYDASAYIVECDKGILPGGNAMSWNWGKAKEFGKAFPFILAGGLSLENIKEAVTTAIPDAVDVSSGVEFEPGRKDIEKVRAFIKAVSQIEIPIENKRNLRVIF